ncbi:MAG: 23S rRNA (guanosine(2251)-2'-O)-methyltransferase RlmB [Acidimicrobiales bacterium]
MRRTGQRAVALGGEHVEGHHAVRELLVASRRRVEEIVVVDTAKRSPEIAEIISLARSRKVPVRPIPPQAFRALATSSVPQGVVARAEPLVSVRLDDLVNTNSRSFERIVPFLVVLSEVTDPHNLGAILRSALGAGATGVVMGRRRSAPLSASAVKAAAGAVEHLPIALVASIAEALRHLSKIGLWTVGLDPKGESSVLDLEVADRPIALVAGAEGRGLPALVARRCDLLCRIPLYGPVESLNVSVAVALAAFSVASRRGIREYRTSTPDGPSSS